MTRYEIAARHTDGRAFLLCYLARKTRVAIIDAMLDRGPAVAAALGIDKDLSWTWLPKSKEYACGGWRIGFTGRTQRDALQEGELPRL